MLHVIQQLKEQLLAAVNKEGEVTDEDAVLRVITALEKMPVMPEILEVTRIGKHVNELRKKVKDKQLARQAKKLIHRWQKLVTGSSEASSGGSTPNGHIKSLAAKSSEVTARLLGIDKVQRDSPLASSQGDQYSDTSAMEGSSQSLNDMELTSDVSQALEVLEVNLDPPMFDRQRSGVDGLDCVGHFFDWTAKMPLKGSEDGVIQPYVHLEY